MTVSELIELLREMPQDAEACIADSVYGAEDVMSVELEGEMVVIR